MERVTVAERIKKWVLIDGRGCWIWTRGLRNSWGNGDIRVNGKSQLVHRASYEAFVGKIPDSLFVLHRCDNPRCCNPEHLFLGTHKDNMEDMASKGRARTRHGADNSQAKLTSHAASEIRRLKGAGVRVSDLARQFGVSRRAIGFVIKGVTWK